MIFGELPVTSFLPTFQRFDQLTRDFDLFHTVHQAWGQAPKGLSPLDLSPFLRGLKSGLKSSFNKRA